MSTLDNIVAFNANGLLECGQVEIDTDTTPSERFDVLAQPNLEFPLADYIEVVNEKGVYFQGNPQDAPPECAEAVAMARAIILDLSTAEPVLIEL